MSKVIIFSRVFPSYHPMREIKFRFWSGEKMFFDADNVLECLRQQIAFDMAKKTYPAYDHVGLHGASFMQYTGLKDESSREIYEGDIVKYGTPYHGEITTILTGKIVYNDHGAAFQIAYVNIYNSFVTDFCHKFTIIDVIGNIHENPELLK